MAGRGSKEQDRQTDIQIFTLTCVCLGSPWQFICPWIFIFFCVSLQLQCPAWDTYKTLLFFAALLSPWAPALSSHSFLGVSACVPEIQVPKWCFHTSSFVPFLWDWILSWRTSCFFMGKGGDMECLL